MVIRSSVLSHQQLRVLHECLRQRLHLAGHQQRQEKGEVWTGRNTVITVQSEGHREATVCQAREAPQSADNPVHLGPQLCHRGPSLRLLGGSENQEVKSI